MLELALTSLTFSGYGEVERFFISQLPDGTKNTSGNIYTSKLDLSGNQLGYKAIWRVSVRAFGAQAGTSLTYSRTESNVASPSAQHNFGAPATNCLIVLYHLSGGKHMAMYVLVAVVNCNYSTLLTNFTYTALKAASPTF